MFFIGIDIGGTKCAICIGKIEDKEILVIEKESFLTERKTPSEILNRFSGFISFKQKYYNFSGIGISCGGPLDSKRGIIKKPPSLPLWDNIEIVKYFSEKFDIPVYLENDANAGAVAEWQYGAGKGYNNIIFITFGTGFGAGLILNGKLYAGANDNAGEVGHVRLTKTGPIGYNKAGSVEGYCSGNGIKRLAINMVKKELKKGNKLRVLEKVNYMDEINAKLIADLAHKGDEFCLNVYKKSGEMLGRALSMLIDILNPEIIAIGGVYMRSSDLLYPYAKEVINKECLSYSRNICKVVPAKLSENIGDISALSIAKGDYK